MFKVGEIFRVAGQIGMIPGTLELIEGGVLKQCRLSLRHIGRITAALDPNMQIRDVVQGIFISSVQIYSKLIIIYFLPL